MIQNMRDLGGLKTQNGKTIKPNCLIRSAHLYQAKESELTGLCTVITVFGYVPHPCGMKLWSEMGRHTAASIGWIG